MSKKIVILGNGYVGGNLYDRLLYNEKKPYEVKIEKRKLLNYNDIKNLEIYLSNFKFFRYLASRFFFHFLQILFYRNYYTSI